jgi:hypothetical protein
MAAFLMCCESDYTRMVKAELAKGVRKDSVFLGLRLGNTRQEFYGKCFDLNKAHLVTQGPEGAAMYIFKDSSVHARPTEIRVLFVPAFDDKDVITNIDLNFTYTAWAPWNREMQADSLESKVEKLLMRWYGGNNFVTAKTKDAQLPVKVDGNRRVVIYRKEPQNVIVKVQDLLHPKFKHSKV